jgi:acyl carrier protein
MTDEALFEKVARTMAVVIGIDQSEIKPDSSMDSIDKWDSLKHMKMIMALEQEFDVMFDDEDVVEMLSVPLILIAIKEKVA